MIHASRIAIGNAMAWRARVIVIVFHIADVINRVGKGDFPGGRN